MPHAGLKYSTDLEIDAKAVLQAVELVIQRHDAGSGMCKGRAYPAEIFHHTHCILNVSMLTKPHRDAAFTHALLDDLTSELGRHITQKCALSVGIQYSGAAYYTGEHDPTG